MILQLFKGVISLSLMSSVIALIVIGLKAIFKEKFSGRWHYFIWFILVLRLMIPYFPESSFSIFNIINPITHVIVNNVNPNMNKVNNSLQSQQSNSKSTNDGITNMMPNNDNGNTSKQENKGNINYYDILSWIWLFGMITMIIWIFGAYYVFMKNSKNKNIDDDNIKKIFNYCKEYMDIKKDIPLLYSSNVKTPSIAGIIKPRLLIPDGMLDKLSIEEIKYIFIHELSHYRRKDVLISWIITVLQCINWFNPIIWYAFNQMKSDAEVACDEYVLDHIRNNERKKYGETIIKLTALTRNFDLIPGTAGIAGKFEVRRRIVMISMFKKKPVIWTIVAIVIAIVIGYVGLTNARSIIPTKNISNNGIPPLPASDKNRSSKNNNISSTSNSSIGSTDKQNNENNNTKTANSKDTGLSTEQKQLIDKIWSLAKNGEVINSNAIAGKTTIDEVVKELGNPDKQNYVTSAKGIYSTYKNKNLVFGSNKGAQIFEVRSNDSKITILTLSSIQNILGSPDYNNVYGNQHIIGYKVNDNYKLEFVFPKETPNDSNPKLDHLNVLYPQGTVNNMANDPGRLW